MGIVYSNGTVTQGPILIGNVGFGGFTVLQAFSECGFSFQYAVSAPGSNATTNGDTGLLGVGRPGLSQISDTLQGSQFNSKTVLENVAYNSLAMSPNLNR